MTRFVLKVLVICVALTTSSYVSFASTSLPELPTYTCKRASDKIEIDGVLNEQSWERAKPLHLVLRDDNGIPIYRTVTKAIWADYALYVSFVCKDPEIWATMTKRDDPLWTEEVVEVFLDPNRNGDPYFEIEVNPLNVVVDLRFMRSLKGLQPSRSIKWDCQALETAIKTEGQVNSWQTESNPDNSWTVEMAIPFKALDSLPNFPPKEGDTWRANFYRIERPAQLAEEDDEYSCWSSIVISKSYHTLERFGTLIFSYQKVGEDK